MQHQDDSTLRVSADDVERARPPKPLGERELSKIVERVFEFVWLSQDEPEPDVALRVGALRQQLASPTEDVREFWRVPAHGLAELERQVGRLSDIGGGGICVATVHALDAGSEMRVRVTDDEAGWVYEFPCVVVWSSPDPDPHAGLRFTGRPRRARLD